MLSSVLPHRNKQVDYNKTIAFLQKERDLHKAKLALMDIGVSAAAADELVERATADIKAHNRRKGVKKLFGGLLILAIFGAIYLFMKRLYFIILPCAGIAFLWGMLQMLAPSGYDYDLSDEEA